MKTVVAALLVCSLGFTESLSKANVLSWKASYRVPEEREVEAQRHAVKTALAACKEQVKAQVNAADLYEEWKLPQLEEQLSRSVIKHEPEDPESFSDRDSLAQTLSALKVDKAPLEKQEFHRLRLEIAKYRGLIISADPSQQARYEAQIETVARLCDLPKYTESEEAELRAALSGLAVSGQATPLIDWWHHYRSLPNFSARISGAVLSRLTHKAFSQSQPVSQDKRDPATGKTVHLKGTARFNGSGGLRLVPDRSRARAEVTIQASAQGNVTATTEVLGRTAAVQILSQSSLSGGIPIEILPNLSLRIGEIQLAVQTQTTPYAPQFEARLPLVRRMGARKVLQKAQQSIPQSNYETEQLIESQIRTQVSGKMEPILAPLKAAANDALLFPLLRAERFPRIAFSTDTQSLNAKAWLAGREEFGAFVPEVAFSGGDVELSLHESVIGNVGREVSDKKLGDDVVRKTLFGGFLKQPEGDMTKGEIISEIRFAKENPVTATIQEGYLGIRLSLQSFALEGKEYDIPCTLAARWKISTNGTEIKLARDGEPEIRGGKALDENKRAKKGLPTLANRLLVPNVEAELKPLEFDFAGKKMTTPLRISQFKAESGWVTVQLEVKGD